MVSNWLTTADRSRITTERFASSTSTARDPSEAVRSITASARRPPAPTTTSSTTSACQPDGNLSTTRATPRRSTSTSRSGAVPPILPPPLIAPPADTPKFGKLSHSDAIGASRYCRTTSRGVGPRQVRASLHLRLQRPGFDARAFDKIDWDVE